MKVSIEGTDADDGCAFAQKASIEMPHDDLTMDGVIENLGKPALLGWG
jgi:hypothetical protein